MKIHVAPITKFSSYSKLSHLLEHLGWQTTTDRDAADASIWITCDAQPDPRYFNHRPIALNKQRVNDIFAVAFGYPVEVNPETHQGRCVEKKLDHGTHGTVVMCPHSRRPDRCYQKLLWNVSTMERTDELRLDIFGQRMIVSLKHQVLQPNGMPQARRTEASTVFDVAPETLLSPFERDCVHHFCQRVGLDYGGIDAIRHVDGKLYLIDATTNVGIPGLRWHINLTRQQYLDRESELLVALVKDKPSKLWT